MSLPDHDKGLAVDSDGYLRSVSQRHSPHCDRRPDAGDISLLVVHGISLPAGCFGGSEIDALFRGTLAVDDDPRLADLQGLRVSAHLLIRRDGELIQYVPFSRRAWHAGESCFDGRECCNDFSIGIELEGCDELAYEEAQYRCLAEVCRVLLAHYPALARERIVGHSDIAPGRKTDPGPAFDWRRLFRLLDGLPAVGNGPVRR